MTSQRMNRQRQTITRIKPQPGLQCVGLQMLPLCWCWVTRGAFSKAVCDLQLSIGHTTRCINCPALGNTTQPCVPVRAAHAVVSQRSHHMAVAAVGFPMPEEEICCSTVGPDCGCIPGEAWPPIMGEAWPPIMGEAWPPTLEKDWPPMPAVDCPMGAGVEWAAAASFRRAACSCIAVVRYPCSTAAQHTPDQNVVMCF